jgi:hypothetical protein
MESLKLATDTAFHGLIPRHRLIAALTDNIADVRLFKRLFGWQFISLSKATALYGVMRNTGFPPSTYSIIFAMSLPYNSHSSQPTFVG